MANNAKRDGFSLAKGPVALIGLALLAYGITGLLFGGNGFEASPVDGTEQGKNWLGLEGNGWTNVLFAGAGALLVFGSPLHWGAKSLALIVGLVLGAASVIALVDGDDVFGIFAANGLTKLVWGIAAAVLLVLSLLPRVGKKKKVEDRDVARHAAPAPRPARQPRVVEPEPVREPAVPVARETHMVEEPARERVSSRVVAPASGTTPESRETTRRQHDGEL